jgi:hypothetical protein
MLASQQIFPVLRAMTSHGHFDMPRPSGWQGLLRTLT